MPSSASSTVRCIKHRCTHTSYMTHARLLHALHPHKVYVCLVSMLTTLLQAYPRCTMPSLFACLMLSVVTRDLAYKHPGNLHNR